MSASRLLARVKSRPVGFFFFLALFVYRMRSYEVQGGPTEPYLGRRRKGEPLNTMTTTGFVNICY